MKLSAVPVLLLVSGCGTIPTHAEAVDLGDSSSLQLSGPCIPKIGMGIDPKFEAMCRDMTEPRVWRGLWAYESNGRSFARSRQNPAAIDQNVIQISPG